MCGHAGRLLVMQQWWRGMHRRLCESVVVRGCSRIPYVRRFSCRGISGTVGGALRTAAHVQRQTDSGSASIGIGGQMPTRTDRARLAWRHCLGGTYMTGLGRSDTVCVRARESARVLRGAAAPALVGTARVRLWRAEVPAGVSVSVDPLSDGVRLPARLQCQDAAEVHCVQLERGNSPCMCRFGGADSVRTFVGPNAG